MAAEAVGDFFAGTLFDRDLVAGVECEVEGRAGGGDVERDAVGVSQDGD